MRQTTSLLATAVLIASPWADAAPTTPHRIVALGDSTTFGYSVNDSYPRLLAKLLFEAGHVATVVNAGVNGDTTDGARQRFARDVTSRAPEVVVIQFGLNDQTIRLYEPPEKTASYVTEKQFLDNLRYFISEARRSGAKPILMTANPMCWTPTLERHYPAGPFIEGPRGGNSLLARYMKAERNLAQTKRVPLVDVYAAYVEREHEPRSGLQQVMLDDGVHPNEAGYQLNVALLSPVLLPLLGTNPAPQRPPASYFVVENGSSASAYITGWGCRDGKGCVELKRIRHDRNPRDSISAVTGVEGRHWTARLNLIAENQSEWEISLDSTRQIVFSTTTSAVEMKPVGPTRPGAENTASESPRIDPGPILVEIERDGEQLQVRIDGRTAMEIHTSDERLGPIELAVTSGTIRVKSFHIQTGDEK